MSLHAKKKNWIRTNNTYVESSVKIVIIRGYLWAAAAAA